jgi:uncharacterized membrane protein YgaE (UPF0421/DUF939 family)
MSIDYSEFLKPRWIISGCLVGLIVNYVFVVIFKDQPIVLLICSGFQALFCGWAQPQMWIISTFFPFGDKMRSMLSFGGGFATLLTVFLDTIIRVITYNTVHNKDPDQLQHQDVSFYIFFGIFYLFLATALLDKKL